VRVEENQKKNEQVVIVIEEGVRRMMMIVPIECLLEMEVRMQMRLGEEFLVPLLLIQGILVVLREMRQ
jgi:hypothetical protein